jgi:hypothetical protein
MSSNHGEYGPSPLTLTHQWVILCSLINMNYNLWSNRMERESAGKKLSLLTILWKSCHLQAVLGRCTTGVSPSLLTGPLTKYFHRLFENNWHAKPPSEIDCWPWSAPCSSVGEQNKRCSWASKTRQMPPALSQTNPQYNPITPSQAKFQR